MFGFLIRLSMTVAKTSGGKVQVLSRMVMNNSSGRGNSGRDSTQSRGLKEESGADPSPALVSALSSSVAMLGGLALADLIDD